MSGGIPAIAEKKHRGEKIVALTAYDYVTAILEERAGVDLILVGDSIGMAVLGEETTLTVGMEVMVAHTRAVRLGAPETVVVGDMPFGSYEPSDAAAVKNAVRFLAEGGADAVKLEGGNDAMVSRVRAIVDSGIPVMGHVGLLPQSIRKTGGYRVVKNRERDAVLREAEALQDAGIFALVLEGMEESLAAELTSVLKVPTIGIGAGRYTDGQILVVNDILGLSPGFMPRFVKRYGDVSPVMEEAFENYVTEVRKGIFPDEKHVYGSGVMK